MRFSRLEIPNEANLRDDTHGLQPQQRRGHVRRGQRRGRHAQGDQAAHEGAKDLQHAGH